MSEKFPPFLAFVDCGWCSAGAAGAGTLSRGRQTSSVSGESRRAGVVVVASSDGRSLDHAFSRICRHWRQAKVFRGVMRIWE